MWSDSLSRAQRMALINESEESESLVSSETLPRMGALPGLPRFNSEEEEIEEEKSSVSQSSSEEERL